MFIPEHKRPPVKSMTADELMQELVSDAVAHHATDLSRFIAAINRIGKLQRIGSEGAFQALRNEVGAIVGRSELPMFSGPLA